MPKKSWEIGTDLLWLIDKNTLPANNLLLRRNYTSENGVRHAWRMRFGIDLSHRDSLNITDPLDNELKRTSILIRLGHEWQYLVEDKALLYFGGDLHFSYQRNYEQRLISRIDPPSGRFRDNLELIYQPGVVLFVGAKFHIRSWVSLNLESELFANYRIKSSDNVTKSLNPLGGTGGFGLEESETLNVVLLPFTAFTLSFLK